MSSKPDLRYIDAELESLHRSLTTISSGFESDARVAEDVSGVVGHPGLGERLTSFSESWRVNRDRMREAIDSLAGRVRTITDVSTMVDVELGGGDSSSGQSTTDSTDSTTSQNATATSGSGSTDQLSAVTPSGSAASAPSASVGSTSETSTFSEPSGSAVATPDPGPDAGGGGIDGATAPDTSVRLGEDGDFYASVTVGGAAAAGATATMMALYQLWESRKGGATGSTGSDVDARSRLLSELDELRGPSGQDVTVELVSDGQTPDRITAILRGEDGSVSVVDVSPEPTTPDATAADPTSVADADATGGGATDPAPTDPGSGPADSAPVDGALAPDAQDGGGASGGSAGEPSSGSADLPPVTESSATDAASSDTVSGAGSGDLPPVATSPGAVGAASGGTGVAGMSSGVPDADASIDGAGGESITSPHVAGATAGMGVAGMGAVSAAGAGQGASSSSPARSSEQMRKVTESSTKDEAREEEQR